jgi:hypothetical protein
VIRKLSVAIILILLGLGQSINSKVQENSGTTNGLLKLLDYRLFENSEAPWAVGQLDVLSGDYDKGEYIYTISGADADKFIISKTLGGDPDVYLSSNVTFDYETRTGYEIIVRATEPNTGNYIERDFTILVGDLSFEDDNHQPVPSELRNYYEAKGNLYFSLSRASRKVTGRLEIREAFDFNQNSDLDIDSRTLVSQIIINNFNDNQQFSNLFNDIREAFEVKRGQMNFGDLTLSPFVNPDETDTTVNFGVPEITTSVKKSKITMRIKTKNLSLACKEFSFAINCPAGQENTLLNAKIRGKIEFTRN